jgi:hypothetical protein
MHMSARPDPSLRVPANLLLPFEARRLSAPRIALTVAHSQPISDAEVIDRFAYAAPAAGADGSAFLPDTKTFFAERYGGTGIGTHGGGVRCGNDGRYQVKGIGRNLLCGEEAEFNHSHGGESLLAALLEAMWGEILHRALPFGAVRAYAVIRTGLSIPADGPNDVLAASQGALLVRQAALRPAHFMRALYFRPSAAVRTRIEPDALRVRKAIGDLPELLPHRTLHGISEHDPSRCALLEEGLTEMVRRFAEQFAAAKAKCIAHRLLNASNICLDGRWIDLSGVVALPRHANFAGQGLWDEPRTSLAWLGDFCFYIGKYLDRIPPLYAPQAASLAKLFQSFHEAAVLRRFVYLSGLPDVVVAPYWDRSEVHRLGLLIATLAFSEDARIAREAPRAASLHPSRLGRVLVTLARWYADETCEARLRQLLSISIVSPALMTYRDCMSLVSAQLARSGVCALAFRRILVLNAYKSATGIAGICGSKLSDTITDLVDRYRQPEELRLQLQALLLNLCQRSEMIFEDPMRLRTVCWVDDNARVEFCALENRWRVHRGGGASTLAWEAIDDPPMECIRRMRDYWGQGLWDLLS